MVVQIVMLSKPSGVSKIVMERYTILLATLKTPTKSMLLCVRKVGIHYQLVKYCVVYMEKHK